MTYPSMPDRESNAGPRTHPPRDAYDWIDQAQESCRAAKRASGKDRLFWIRVAIKEIHAAESLQLRYPADWEDE